MDRTALKAQLTQAFGISAAHKVEDYADRLTLFLPCLARLPGVSAQQAHEYELLITELREFVGDTSTMYSRQQLYSSLTVAPFATALQLIDVGQRKESVLQHMLLLAHLYVARGHRDYPAYLAFYKVINSIPFASSFLSNCTLDELRMETQSLGGKLNSKPLNGLRPFLQHPSSKLRKPARSISSGVNRHARDVAQTALGDTTYLAFSDADGVMTSDLLQHTPKLAVSEGKKRHQFSQKQAGIQNALYNHESATPWASHAATPAEIKMLLQHINNEMLDGSFGQLTPQTASLLVILFLKMLGITAPEKLIVINAGSPKYQTHTHIAGTLIYEINKASRHLDAHIVFNASLLKVQKPISVDMRIHHVAQDTIDLSLPYPLSNLLKAAFRDVPAAKRNHQPLSHALSVDVTNYRHWLKESIRRARLDAIGLTPKHIENAFFHFAKELVPEVFFNYLRGTSTVQHHYVSAERSEVEKTLKSGWFEFLDAAHFQRKSSSFDNFLMPLARAHHDHVGSAHTLRNEVLNAILQHCIERASDVALPALERLNRIALFIYLRIATTSALRPVKAPLPAQLHVHESLGILSVADKKAHHKDERRIITLLSSTKNLLREFTRSALKICQKYNLPLPSASLMHFDSKRRSWQDFSGSNTNPMLSQICNDIIHNRSFRHVAASTFIQAQITNKRVSQSCINLLMNHSRASVSVLNSRSLISIARICQIQRQYIEDADGFKHHDADALRQLKALGGKG